MIAPCYSSRIISPGPLAFRPCRAFMRGTVAGRAGRFIIPATMKQTPEERFWSKVNKNGAIPTNQPELGACWQWMGAISERTGYGQFSVENSNISPHRFSWELHFGPIPENASVLQTCRNFGCANPLHLRCKSHEERFFENVIRNENLPNCWEWVGSLRPNGYGVFGVNGESIRSHRWSFGYVRGVALNPEIKILHNCDNPKCVSPFHTRSGTIQDNVDDMVSRGRDFKSKGEDRPEAKLTEQDVRDIRRDYRPWENSMRMLAKKYCVTHVVIKMVIHRRTWRHVI